MESSHTPVIGRPSTYDPVLAGKILEDMSDGLNMAQACRKHNLPRTTLYRWKENYPEFATCLTRALKDCAHSLVDNTLEMALAPTNKDQAAAARIAIENNWRWAGKFEPMYGDKQTIAHENAMPIRFIEGVDEKKL